MDLWKCPVCGKALSVSDLEIDQYIWQILNQVSNISLQAIAFDNDAKWTPLKEIDEGQSVKKIKPGQRIIVFSEDAQQHSASPKLLSQSSPMRNKFGQENTFSVGDPSSSEASRISIPSTLEQSLMSQAQQTLKKSTSSSNDNGIKHGDSSVSSSSSLLSKSFCSSQFSSFMNYNDSVSITSVRNETFPFMPQNAPAAYQFSLIEVLSPQPCSHSDELLTLGYSDGLPTPQYSDGLPTPRPSTPQPSKPVDEQGQMNSRITQHVYHSITGESADTEKENHKSNLETTVISSGADGGRPALHMMEPIAYCNDDSLEIPTIDLSELTGTYCDASYTQIGLNTANFASYLEPSEKSSHDDMNKAPTTTLSDFVDELLSCML